MRSRAVGTAAEPAAGSEWPLRIRAAATVGKVGALHPLAFGLLGVGALDSAAPLAAGLVTTAYLTGVRHSYDWDHIATIDNSTRRFVAQGKQPTSIGLAFSLGHSSVVILAGTFIVAGAGPVSSLIQQGTAVHTAVGLVGGTESGLFLLVMGSHHTAACHRCWSLRRRMHQGDVVSVGDLETPGPISQVLAKPLSRVRSPRNIYTLGFLFGLGFDTAGTISLLILTASASMTGVSGWALLSLPFFFAAGMCLCDTANGLAVLKMYRSTWQDPTRKLGFNILITGLSAFSALFISVITIGGMLHHGLGLHDPLTGWLAAVDLGHAGLLLIGIIFVAWGLAALAWKVGPRLSEKTS